MWGELGCGEFAWGCWDARGCCGGLLGGLGYRGLLMDARIWGVARECWGLLGNGGMRGVATVCWEAWSC